MNKSFTRRARRLDGTEAQKLVVWYSKNPGAPRGFPTGLRDLDYWTGGQIDGELTLVAARPSVGKTSLVMSIADRVINQLRVERNETLVFISQEMREAALLWRWGGIRSGVSGKAIERGEYRKHGIPVPVSKDQYRKFYDSIGQVSAHPCVYLIDTPLTTAELRQELQAIKDDGQHIRLVVDDYLALHTDANENEVQRINGIARALKNLANDFNAPFLTVAQLNRAVERREGSKIPTLADLRDGGEADADNVWFVHRDDYYNPGEEQRPVQKAAIYVAKARNYETGVIPLKFTNYITRFDDWDEEGKSYRAA